MTLYKVLSIDDSTEDYVYAADSLSAAQKSVRTNGDFTDFLESPPKDFSPTRHESYIVSDHAGHPIEVIVSW